MSRPKLVVLLVALVAVAWTLVWAFVVPPLVGDALGDPDPDTLRQLGAVFGGGTAVAAARAYLRRYGRKVHGTPDGRDPQQVTAENLANRPLRTVAPALAAADPELDRRVRTVLVLRRPLFWAGVIGGVAALGAVVSKLLRLDDGPLFYLGVTGLGTLAVAATLDWLVCQHRIFRLRLLKIQRTRIPLDAETLDWVARQRRLLRVDAVVSRLFVLVLAGAIVGIVMKAPIGIMLGAFGVAAVAFIVNMIAVRRRLAWSEMLSDLRDIKGTVSGLTGGVIG
jgi:hypothetical protein